MLHGQVLCYCKHLALCIIGKCSIKSIHYRIIPITLIKPAPFHLCVRVLLCMDVYVYTVYIVCACMSLLCVSIIIVFVYCVICVCVCFVCTVCVCVFCFVHGVC